MTNLQWAILASYVLAVIFFVLFWPVKPWRWPRIVDDPNNRITKK